MEDRLGDLHIHCKNIKNWVMICDIVDTQNVASLQCLIKLVLQPYQPVNH